jgi:acyl carrier protein
VNHGPDTDLLERLLAHLQGLLITLDGKLSANSSLIKSGLLDSAAILNLAEWIQREVGPNVDLLQFDLSKEWETVADIESFIRRHRNPSPD